jgi:putative holliday junction resolvase
MARLLAIDYGGKRCGIAISDPSQIIASGLTTVASSELIDFLKKYFLNEEVELVIIGLPKSLQNTDTHGTILVTKFIEVFKATFTDIKIITLDERFTSKMAVSSMLASGMKKKDRQNKSLVDEISATIILQDYMASIF